MINRLKTTLRQMRVGITLTALTLVGTALYTHFYGPLYDRWNWAELSVGLLILSAAGMGFLESMARLDHPDTRTSALYNMMDVPPAKTLRGERVGWIIHTIPMLVVAVVLILALLLT